MTNSIESMKYAILQETGDIAWTAVRPATYKTLLGAETQLVRFNRPNGLGVVPDCRIVELFYKELPGADPEYTRTLTVEELQYWHCTNTDHNFDHTRSDGWDFIQIGDEVVRVPFCEWINDGRFFDEVDI